MLVLCLGLIMFIGVHALKIFASKQREAFIASYGDNKWKAAYSLISLLGFALIIYGFGLSRVDPIFIWNPPLWTRHIAILFTLFAFILLAASGISGNHFSQKLGHPMYAGIKIWAFAHLIANGTLADILLFGSFLLWAVLGFVSSRKKDRKEGVTYPAATISKTGLTVVAGLLAWLVFAGFLHKLLIGVSPM